MSVASGSNIKRGGADIEYPETDGKPMGETDWHIDWTLLLRDMLKYRYRGQKVYVASDLLLYYHEGVPRDFVVPDGFVVLNCEPRQRRVFKTWEEKRVPNVVFEFTSASTRRSDEVFKPRTYAEIGVKEYFIFDPHIEYLDPPLQGFELIDGAYRQLSPDAHHRIKCRELNLTLEIHDDDLLIRDASSGQPITSEAKGNALTAERNALEAERNALEAKRHAAEAERLARTNGELKEELQRLRDELRRHDRNA